MEGSACHNKGPPPFTVQDPGARREALLSFKGKTIQALALLRQMVNLIMDQVGYWSNLDFRPVGHVIETLPRLMK